MDPFVLQKLQHRDFKFNRIPETLVVDHIKKAEKAMSFHHLHLLGPAIVLQVIVVPRVNYLFFSISNDVTNTLNDRHMSIRRN